MDDNYIVIELPKIFEYEYERERGGDQEKNKPKIKIQKFIEQEEINEEMINI